MNLQDRLALIAAQQPQKIALQDPAKRIDWQTMMSTVERIAEQLKPFKYQVVALYADNSVDWVMVDLACVLAEVILLPLPTFFSPKQLEHSLESSSAAAIVTDNADFVSQLAVETQNDGNLTDTLQLRVINLQDEQAAIPEQTRKITFTSGSTGQPKGVCLSIANQLAVADALIERTELSAPNHLCVLPLSTLLENIAGVYAPLLTGGKVMLLPASEMGFNGGKGFDAQQFIRAISEQQPTSLILLPELLQALLLAVEAGWQVPESIEFIAVGGSKVSSSLLLRAQHLGLPVYEGYGLSECSSVVCLNGPHANQPGTVGQILSHVRVQLVDGQVVVTGNVFLGYLNQPDSWGVEQVYTGDIGEFDDAGYLHINGRIKNLLISSFGRNISPEWVESEVMANPMIKHCVVIGDAKPFCSALIQKRDQAIPDTMVDEWLTRVNQQLPDYAQIADWRTFVEPLSIESGTVTPNGRPVRDRIYNRYQLQIDELYKENI